MWRVSQFKKEAIDGEMADEMQDRQHILADPGASPGSQVGTNGQRLTTRGCLLRL
jgi:hypothetical protein